jgi:hypothetical protein
MTTTGGNPKEELYIALSKLLATFPAPPVEKPNKMTMNTPGMRASMTLRPSTFKGQFPDLFGSGEVKGIQNDKSN